jgi:histidine triad (HIT) family protein
VAIVYEDDHVVAFKDLNPKAPIRARRAHRHVATLNDLSAGDDALVGE